MALVDVVADGTRGGAIALADRDGNGLAIVEGHHDRATGNGRVDSGSVKDGSTLSYGRCGGQGDGGGVRHVRHAGADLALVRHQVFVATTGHAADAVGDGRMALIDVIADDTCSSAGTLADRDGDDLTIGQRDHDRVAGHWRADGGGVEDGPAFGYGRRGRQGHRCSVLHIGNGGADRRGIGHQAFVVAAADGRDGVGDRRMSLVDVVAHGAGGRAGALAYGDGDDLPIGQGHDHCRAADGGIHRGGVDDGAALGDGWCGSQGHGSGVLHVRDVGADLGLVGDQVLVIAARHVADAVGDRGMALINIIAHGAGRSSRTLADRDGDGLAIGQGHHDRAAGDRRSHACGVDDGAAFQHGRRGGQADRGGVLHIRDSGADWRLIGHQIFVVAPADPGDAVADRRMPLVGIVIHNRSDRSRTLPDRDGDGLAIGKADDQWRASHRCIHGHGVDDGATLGDGGGRRQSQGDAVRYIGHAGTDRRLVCHQIFEVAPADPGNAVADCGMPLVRLVAHRSRGCADALANGDADGLPIAEGDHHRSPRHRCVEGHGVDNASTLGHRSCRAQGCPHAVQHVGDVGADRCRVGHQVFIIAATDPDDAVGHRCVPLVHVVACSSHGRAGALADRNGDDLSVGQADEQR